MTRKFMILLLGLTVRGFMTPPLFAQQVSTLIQESNTEHLTLTPGSVIRIDGSYGELNIEGWNKPEVEITITKTLPYGYDKSKAAKDLKTVMIKTEKRSDKELDISTTIATHDSWFSSVARTKTDVMLEYQIHAPRDSKLISITEMVP